MSGWSLSGCASFVAAAALSASPLGAWGETGHRIVALAAQEVLTDRSKVRITYLLGRETELIDAAGAAHEMLSERPETEAWHSIAIPAEAEGVDLDRDCPQGECVTSKLRECIGIVRLAIRPRSEIVESFKLLVGLTAHLHQPLVSGHPPGDDKANAEVQLDGETMSLMEALDSGLLERLGSEEEVLDLVRQQVSTLDREQVTAGTYRDWTWETHRVALDRVYSLVTPDEPNELDEAAREALSSIVVDQLAKAAIRMAHILTVVWP